MEEEIFERYRKGGQGHVLKFLDGLTESERLSFVQNLGLYDVERLNQIFKASVLDAVPETTSFPIAPPKKEMVVNLSEEEKSTFFEKGLDLIRDGKVGVIILAGGQGTRLKFDKAKALFPFTELPSKKTLLQIQLERVMSLEKLSKSEKQIQVYLMTSGSTNDDIERYLEQSNYFGMKKDQVHLFQQNGYPCFDTEGKFLLQEKGKLTFAPNGNGAMYEALKVCGMLVDMKKRGVEYVHMVAVDNIIVRVADPTFVAKCADMKSDFGSKVIPKRGPHERVGVFGLKQGKVHVVEYSEITKEMAEMKKDDGSGELLFNESNIVNFCFTRDFLERCAHQVNLDRHHVARKDIPALDENGDDAVVKGIKLELFNFDVCEYANNVCLLVGSREQDFSPLKNAEGNDSQKTCIAHLSKLHLKYLLEAGARIDTSNVQEDSMVCEISPLISYQGENLESFKGVELKLPIFIK